MAKNKFAAYPRLNPLGVGRIFQPLDLIDQTFLAYNGGRLREAAQLLTRRNVAGRWLHRHEPDRRAHSGGLWQIMPDSADEGRLRRLDRFNRRELYHDCIMAST